MAKKSGKPQTNPASLANLKPFNAMDPAEAKEIRQKGADAANAVRRQRRALRDIYAELLAEQMPAEMQPEDVQDYAKKHGKTLDTYEALALAQLLKAAQGDTRAAEFVRDSAGDKPGEVVSVETSSLSDADRQMLENLQKRINNA